MQDMSPGWNQGQASPLGRDRQSRADGQAVPPVVVPGVRRLPSGRPRPTDIGDQQKAALVDEDEVGSPPIGVFLSAGQASCFH